MVVERLGRNLWDFGRKGTVRAQVRLHVETGNRELERKKSAVCLVPCLVCPELALMLALAWALKNDVLMVEVWCCYLGIYQEVTMKNSALAECVKYHACRSSSCLAT